MKVNDKSQWALENAPVYSRCRATVAGGDAVKALGAEHLPPLSGADFDANAAYLQRALFFNATQRTLDAFVGMALAKPAAKVIPAALEPIAEDMDGAGTTLETFVRAAVSEVLTVGAGVALIDYPERQANIVTAQQERIANLRPFVAWYPAETILDYRTDKVGFTFLRLLEEHIEEDGEWAVKAIPQVRVYDLVEGFVRIRVYRKMDTGAFEIVGGEVFPTGPSGAKLERIPARWFGPVEDAPGKPPMLDLIDVNLAHYRNSADMEHALHFTGLPTPYAAGVDASDFPKGLVLGSTSAYAFSDAQAKIAFATYGAEGLGALEKAMDRKVEYMAALGARMLAPDTESPESGKARAIRATGENSALAKLADSVSGSVVWVLQTMAEWAGIAGDIAYSLDTDYLPERIGAQELVALVTSWQAGAISSPELFESLQAGGVIRDDKDYEEHEEEVLGSDGLEAV